MFSFFYCSKYVFLALQIDTLLACGGLAKNPLFLQEHADIVGLSLFLSLSHTRARTHIHNGYTLLMVKLHMGLMYLYLQQLAPLPLPPPPTPHTQWIQSSHSKTSYGFDVPLFSTIGPW